MTDNYVHFEGDPQTDSARRHLERVLSQPQTPRRRWPWILGLVAGGGSWTIWRAWRRNRDREIQRPRHP